MAPPPFPTNLKRPIDLIVVHCSATPSGKALGTPARSAVGVIDDWHRERGFKREEAARNAFNWRLQSVGYHYVIDLGGYVWTGRHLNEVGAHVAVFNAKSIGICLVGGAELVGRFTPPQWDSLRQLVRQLQAGLFRPSLRVVGHRDLSPDTDGDGQVEQREWLKTCPGFDVSAWLKLDMKPLPVNVIEGAP